MKTRTTLTTRLGRFALKSLVAACFIGMGLGLSLPLPVAVGVAVVVTEWVV